MDLIITGASRGIGRALALETAAPGTRQVLVARDAGRLAEVRAGVEERGGEAVVVRGDLSSASEAEALGAALAGVVRPGATLVHNAGLWPAEKDVGPDGLERAFVVNCLGPLRMQAPLLDRGLLARVMVVGAGLMALGRVDPVATPRGDDYSVWRTYCTTKLCFAVAERDVAARFSDVDFVVLHPGVARTDLGAQRGLLGALLDLGKRLWESPEVCAARLARILQRAPWSPPGDPRWMVKEQVLPWPKVADADATREAVRKALAPPLAQRGGSGG